MFDFKNQLHFKVKNRNILYCNTPKKIVVYPRTATGMDGTLPNCNFENLKPVEISINSINYVVSKSAIFDLILQVSNGRNRLCESYSSGAFSLK